MGIAPVGNFFFENRPRDKTCDELFFDWAHFGVNNSAVKKKNSFLPNPRAISDSNKERKNIGMRKQMKVDHVIEHVIGKLLV